MTLGLLLLWTGPVMYLSYSLNFFVIEKERVLIAWGASLLGFHRRCFFSQSKTKPIREQIEQKIPWGNKQNNI